MHFYRVLCGRGMACTTILARRYLFKNRVASPCLGSEDTLFDESGSRAACNRGAGGEIASDIASEIALSLHLQKQSGLAMAW